MALNDYPLIPAQPNIEDLAKALRRMVQERARDQSEFNNLKNVFVSGRNAGARAAVPTSSTNVLAADREGDIIITPTYIYTLVNNGGTLAWRRAALSTW